MIERLASAALAFVVLAVPAIAQAQKSSNSITYDVTVLADGTPYTGTMTLAIARGKVSGDMHITQPTEITGKPAGTAKGSQMLLDFPYRMVERACDGQIAMTIKLPAKRGAGPATGTVEILGCGRTDTNKLPGTIELKPRTAPKKP